MTGIDALINDLSSCQINSHFIEDVVCQDFKQLVEFYIQGECLDNMESMTFEPQPGMELYEDIKKTIQYLDYGRGYLVLNTEIEKELTRRGLWNVNTKINLFHNQDIVQTLVDYYIDLLHQST